MSDHLCAGIEALLDEIEQYADDSNNAQYGTLATYLVRGYVNKIRALIAAHPARDRTANLLDLLALDIEHMRVHDYRVGTQLVTRVKAIAREARRGAAHPVQDDDAAVLARAEVMQEVMDKLDPSISNLLGSLVPLVETDRHEFSADLPPNVLAFRMAWHYAHQIAKDLVRLGGVEPIQTDEDSVAVDILDLLNVLKRRLTSLSHPVPVTTIEALKALPVGSVLRHPKGSLVEIVTWDLRPDEPIPRIGTYNQNWESLYADWDFPMDLLYLPEVSRG